MSGYPDRKMTHRGILASGAAFIEKPFTLEKLARAIRTALTASNL